MPRLILGTGQASDTWSLAQAPLEGTAGGCVDSSSTALSTGANFEPASSLLSASVFSTLG